MFSNPHLKFYNKRSNIDLLYMLSYNSVPLKLLIPINIHIIFWHSYMLLSETQVSTAMDYCRLLNNSCAIRGLLLILRERCKFRLGLVLRSIKKIPGTSHSFHFHICVITRMLGTKHSNNNQTVSLFKYVKNVLSFHCVCVQK